MVVLLNTYERLKGFVKVAEGLHGSLVVYSKTTPQAIINGSSIIGLLTLNLSVPIMVEYRGEDQKEKENVFAKLRSFN